MPVCACVHRQTNRQTDRHTHTHTHTDAHAQTRADTQLGNKIRLITAESQKQFQTTFLTAASRCVPESTAATPKQVFRTQPTKVGRKRTKNCCNYLHYL